jgi:hypothetical protein
MLCISNGRTGQGIASRNTINVFAYLSALNNISPW